MTDHHINSLLRSLDGLARNIDPSYGLPIRNAPHADRLREAVWVWVAEHRMECGGERDERGLVDETDRTGDLVGVGRGDGMYDDE